MKLATKAVFGALAVAGSVMALSAPASAQSFSFGIDGGNGYVGGYYDSDPYAGAYDPAYGVDPYYDQYAYDDPYACTYYDYYDPPWGYPPDYCNYQVWTDPVYYGGLWYGGPIYYRSYAGANWFWLNGGWRRDEWRGARPGYIDWGRNRYWRGDVHHRPNSRGAWNGRRWDGRNGFTGGNFARGNFNGRGDGRFDGRGNFQGRSFNGGNAFAGRNWNGADGNRFGGDRGRDFGNRNGGQNFAAPQNNDGGRGNFQRGGGFRGRDFANRDGGPNFVAPQNNDGGRYQRGRPGGGQGFVQPNAAPPVAGNPERGRFGVGRFERSNAPGDSAVQGRFGGRSFQAGPQGAPQAGPQGGGFRGGFQGGGDRGAFQGGGNRGGDQGGNRGERRHTRG
jgi:hypothetical protein